MSQKVDLLVDWCSYEAAKYAVERWHYSKTMPAGKTVKLGVWENGKFIGVIIFSRGTNKEIGTPYLLKQTQVCELSRVALTVHVSYVSKIISLALQLIKKQGGLRLVISYADPQEGHNGIIYQATNWVYVGRPPGTKKWRANGQHNRRFGTNKDIARAILGPNVIFTYDEPKHKYLYPLDKAMRRQIEPLAKPYPKCAGEVHDGA